MRANLGITLLSLPAEDDDERRDVIRGAFLEGGIDELLGDFLGFLALLVELLPTEGDDLLVIHHIPQAVASDYAELVAPAQGHCVHVRIGDETRHFVLRILWILEGKISYSSGDCNVTHCRREYRMSDSIIEENSTCAPHTIAFLLVPLRTVDLSQDNRLQGE